MQTGAILRPFALKNITGLQKVSYINVKMILGFLDKSNSLNLCPINRFNWSLCWSIFCNRDGNLSSIHRYMSNHHQQLMKRLNRKDIEGVVSRSHLPILLGKVNLSAFEGLLFTFYGVILAQQQRQWFAIVAIALK